MRVAALSVVLSLLLLAPAGALAADCARTSVSDLEDEVMCPVCGTTLGLAREAPQARRERAFIERLVARCRSKDQIKAALTAEFGAPVLAQPPEKGFGLSAYAVPALLLALALVAIAAAALRWRRPSRVADASADPLLESDHARVEAELARLEHRRGAG